MGLCKIILFRGDGNFLKARQEAKKGELDEQLREYINEWRKQRSKEEEELQRLKEKQSKRKEIRAEQEKKLAQQKREEEERFRREEAEKKALEAEMKRKRLEQAELKRQAMMQAQKEKQNAGGGGGEGGAKLAGTGVSPLSRDRDLLKNENNVNCFLYFLALNFIFQVSPWVLERLTFDLFNV